MKGLIAAGDKRTAFAGGEMLKNGGNAYDALTASVFAAHVSEPALTSPAGGGFLLSNHQGELSFYDFFVNVPKKNKADNIDFYPIEVDFGSTIQIFHIGCASIAVPGLMKGILKIHEKYGNLSLEEVLQPAIKLAKEGLYLTDFQVYVLEILAPIFMKYEETNKIFTRNGEIINSSHLFKNEVYSEFLKVLSKKGYKIFYEGEVADKIDLLSNKNKGLISKEDLKNYKVNKLKPITFDFGGYKIVTSPPPSLGGLLINFTMNLIKENNFKWGSFEYLDALIKAMEITQQFRNKDFKKFISPDNIGYKEFSDVLLKDYLKSYQSKINPFGNTTHISIIDSYGNMVSCTSSNGEGSGILAPDTGIMLNNMLGEEDLNPNGFFKWPSNVRLPSMMCPTMIFKNDAPVLILGSSGSNRIRSALIQTILNYLIYDFDIKNSVENSRIHFENNVVYIEPGFDKSVINLIENHYSVVEFDKKNLFFGGVQAVSGKMEGAADSRRQGFVKVV
jgi:gamma-glutamyltranspeptidase/glutathione hydrolase